MFIDPNDAVLHELKRIADGVSKPAPNAWLDSLKTLATFILGLATAFLSQRLQAWLADDREQTKIRRVVYLELSRNFIELDFMVAKNWNEDGTPVLNGVRWNILNQFLNFDGERLMNEDKKLFYELKEGEVLKQIYYWFHHLDVPKADGTNKFGLSEMRDHSHFSVTASVHTQPSGATLRSCFRLLISSSLSEGRSYTSTCFRLRKWSIPVK